MKPFLDPMLYKTEFIHVAERFQNGCILLPNYFVLKITLNMKSGGPLYSTHVDKCYWIQDGSVMEMPASEIRRRQGFEQHGMFEFVLLEFCASQSIYSIFVNCYSFIWICLWATSKCDIY